MKLQPRRVTITAKSGKVVREEYWAGPIKHREDGPAVTFCDGLQMYFLNNRRYTKKDYYKELVKRGLMTEEEAFLRCCRFWLMLPLKYIILLL